MEHILKMLRISNTPTVTAGEEEIAPEADEPPDDTISELNKTFKKENISQQRALLGAQTRRESLLTRGLNGQSDESPVSPRMPYIPRGLSTTSSHSFASTAELTSDAESILRSASPSPPPLSNQIRLAPVSKPVDATAVVIAPLTKDDKPTLAVETGEAAVEKSLGRKRCIMFACKDTPSDSGPTTEPTAKKEIPKIEPAPRKCRISFACPTRPKEESDRAVTKPTSSSRQPSVPVAKASSKSTSVVPEAAKQTTAEPLNIAQPTPQRSVQHTFHEFASSHDDVEEWVNKAAEVTRPKLTIDDCLKKENAIRKIGKEAEEEAEAEEKEQEELENEYEDDDAVEDDFAPSDEEDTQTDDGNETDNEEGFAESDSESDAGSDYQFWAPSTTSTRATSTDNMTHFSVRSGARSRTSSTSSIQSSILAPQAPIVNRPKTRAIKMRPGTPELPDSTDFVCGTLDEDRPLEAAYISCREQKRKHKHIPIPQDIDPSFPTTDLEDEDDEDDDAAESSEHVWIKDQFEGFDDARGQKRTTRLGSSLLSPAPGIAPPRTGRPTLPSRPTRRSPPPKQGVARSPMPRRLFDHAPRRLRSPPPVGRLRSPRGSPTNMKPALFGITINHLAQRPTTEKTSSLPHTPNPFFRNWRNGSQPVSRITSGHVTPGSENLHPDLHVRGPVDIVIGLEKKRQKRKEKYWRTHCRKFAKEQAEKRPPPGRGVERMKELGLECAERTRGYGLGQPAQLVLSL